MRVVRTREELRTALSPLWRSEQTLGLVPTMGALHRGHSSLVEASVADCDFTAVSIFVNPAQFAPDEDLATYPRDEARDLELIREAGGDLVYAPHVAEVYPDGYATRVRVERLSEIMCGDPDLRGPEHFEGVATVVCKLLNASRPDRAYFGRKDAQQVAVIRRMVEDLEIPVEIVAVPTVRESDGLAMSSRNAYLESGERARAAAIPASLHAGAAVARSDGDLDRAVETVRRGLREAGIEPEYVEARDPVDLAPRRRLDGRPAMLTLSAWVGRARLIDNLLIEPQSGEEEVPRG